MKRSGQSGILSLAVVILLFFGTVSSLLASSALDVTMVLLGDKDASARYSLLGPDAGSVTQLMQAGSIQSVVGPIYPWLAEGDRLISAAGHWDDGSPIKDRKAVLTMCGGGEDAQLVMPNGLSMRTRLMSAGHGVWLWELVVTNQTQRVLDCQPGLAIGSLVTNHEAVWQASDGMAVFSGKSGTCVIGAVSAEGVRWKSPGQGILQKHGLEGLGGLSSIQASLRLSPTAGGRVLFVLSLAHSLELAKKHCLDWMRLDGAGKAMLRAKSVWDAWLTEGRIPFFSDQGLQMSMLRSLRTLILAQQHPGIAPSDARSILDCAEAMRAFGRDRETAEWLAAVPDAIIRSPRDNPVTLSLYPDGRDILLRYASLVSRQTIASGRLAGNLTLVDAGLGAVSQIITASNARMLPVDAVQLEATLHDGALLMQLARRTPASIRMLTNAARARILADRLWSPDARVWTNASGLPDSRAIADVGLQAGQDIRYDLQYRRLRSCIEIVSEREKALLIVAAARAFDLEWFKSAAAKWVKSSQEIPEITRMALWLRMIAEGSLSGCLDEEIICSGFRLETLYRVLLEMRHASTRVASSFVFRDLRSRIRQHLERVSGRDNAFICGLGVSMGELRSEIAKYGLTSELEKRQVVSRLDRIDRMIAGMLSAQGGPSLDTGVMVDGDVVVPASEAAVLELPKSWSLDKKIGEKKETQYRLRRSRDAIDQPEEGRVLVSARCGIRTIWIRGAFVLHNPQPLAMHVVLDALHSPGLVIENRGVKPASVRVLQSSPKIIQGTIPQELKSHSMVVVTLGTAVSGGQARIMLLADAGEKSVRLEKIVELPERIEPDTHWMQVFSDQAVPFRLGSTSIEKLQPNPDGIIRIRKTVAGITHRGALSFGVRSTKPAWELRADDDIIHPVQVGDWLWYDLNSFGTSVISVAFADRKDVTLFAEASKQLVVGVSERE